MSKNMKKLAIITVFVLTLIIIAFSIKPLIGAGSKAQSASVTKADKVKDSDIVIKVGAVTEQPSFYPAEVNGTELEVIAVRASDGSIRTAFNTCQVCYNSGRGYYKYENGKLVCQNCGNTFGMDAVESVKGGCNPVPITEEYKTVNKETITISKDFLVQALQIFQNWKS